MTAPAPVPVADAMSAIAFHRRLAAEAAEACRNEWHRGRRNTLGKLRSLHETLAEQASRDADSNLGRRTISQG